VTSTEPPRRHAAVRAPGRDRGHQQPARTRAMLPRYTESEFAAIGAAAGDAGLTPSGYAADTALAMATGAQPPSTAPWRSAVLELMDARGQVRRVGANVNQVARVLNTAGEPPIWLEQVMALAARAVLRLDEAADAVGDVARHDRVHGQRRQQPRETGE
jgi:Bacterial mobilisation protein (MobC)